MGGFFIVLLHHHRDMRHAITRMIIGMILAGVGVYGLISGKGSNMGICIAFGLLYVGSSLMMIKKNRENKESK